MILLTKFSVVVSGSLKGDPFEQVSPDTTGVASVSWGAAAVWDAIAFSSIVGDLGGDVDGSGGGGDKGDDRFDDRCCSKMKLLLLDCGGGGGGGGGTCWGGGGSLVGLWFDFVGDLVRVKNLTGTFTYSGSSDVVL